jgi:uncharacterized metal-binding protein YceD (DUF177 family)
MIGPSAFSRTIDVNVVPADGLERHIEATADERVAVAEAFGLLGIESLAADVAIVPWRGEGFAVTGRVVARITQRCVVSLAPVEQAIDEPFEVYFVPAGSRLAAALARPEREVAVQVWGAEPPEVFPGRSIDIGAVAEEHFALAIDPYPRAPGAELPAPPDEPGGPKRPESPFAVLEKLKRQGG